MSAEIKVDDSDFRRAFAAFAAGSKRDFGTLLEQQAKLLVKDIARITPPNQNNKWNRPGGEKAVRSDIARLFVPVKKNPTITLGEMAARHKASRRKDGRVRKNPAKSYALASDIRSFTAQQVAKVGILAAGWARSAIGLGSALPAWILRHGTARGELSKKLSGSDLRIRMTNAVKFGLSVKGIERRLQTAMDMRANALWRRVDFATSAAAKKAGFK